MIGRLEWYCIRDEVLFLYIRLPFWCLLFNVFFLLIKLKKIYSLLCSWYIVYCFIYVFNEQILMLFFHSWFAIGFAWVLKSSQVHTDWNYFLVMFWCIDTNTLQPICRCGDAVGGNIHSVAVGLQHWWALIVEGALLYRSDVDQCFQNCMLLFNSSSFSSFIG